jgi:hypothetical protein
MYNGEIVFASNGAGKPDFHKQKTENRPPKSTHNVL